MTNKEELLTKIAKRKAGRREEIEKIPLSALRREYLSREGSDEKMRGYFADAADIIIRYWDNSLMRPVLHQLWRLAMPWVFKKQFRLGKEKRGFTDSVVDYIMYATSYGAWPFEIDEVTDERVVGYFEVCPGKCETHHKLCLAITSMEPVLSKKPFFGATVTFTERIPEGAPRCKVVFERP